MAQYKRRKFFIDRQLQTKYVVLTVLLLLAYTLIFVAVLFLPFVIPLSFDYPVAEQTRAARMLLSLHKTIWPAIGTAILVLSALSIFVTHKIAGPVYRFKKVLGEVSAGNLDISIRLREKDDLKDLAEDLNLVISELRTFVVTLRSDYKVMSSCIDELEAQIRDQRISAETGRELIERLQASKDGITQTLEKYPA